MGRHNQTIVIAPPSALNSTTNICQSGKRRIYIKPKHFCLSLKPGYKTNVGSTPKYFHESHQFGPLQARSSSLSVPPQRPLLPCPASFAFSRLTCWILV